MRHPQAADSRSERVEVGSIGAYSFTHYYALKNFLSSMAPPASSSLNVYGIVEQLYYVANLISWSDGSALLTLLNKCSSHATR
jgi:hypothetical protein